MGSESLFFNCKNCGISISKSANACPKCGAKNRKLSVIHWIGLSIFILFVAVMLNTPDSIISKTPVSPKSIVAISLKDEASKNIDFDFSWKKEGFGNIMEVNFIIKNNSKYGIKDIEIQCDHAAKSGAKIDVNSRIIYEIIPANSKKVFNDFNMGFIHEQVSTSNCYINNFSLLNS